MAGGSGAPAGFGGAPDLAEPGRLVLVRHGATAATEAGRLDGRGGADPGLSAAGERQAAAAARALGVILAGERPRVETSSLARARETGVVIARAFGADAGVESDWDEQHFGDWEGFTVAEACGADAAAYARLREDGAYARPGGESHDDLLARVLPASDRALELSRREGRPVLVVTHRAAIIAVLTSVLGLGSPWSLSIDPGSLTWLRGWADGGVAVDGINDVAHLRG